MPTKYETLLQVLPALAEKVWPGKYTFTSSYHAKSGVYQVHCSRDADARGPFIFLTAEGKNIDEATENLFKHFRLKCKEHWDLAIKEAHEAEQKMQRTEETMRFVLEDLNKRGCGIPAPKDPVDEGT
jgi:hypothetical protein